MLVGMTSELPRRGNSRRANSLRPSIKRTGAPGGPWPAGEHPHQRGADDRHGHRGDHPRLISNAAALPAHSAPGGLSLLVGMTSELPRRGNSRRANSLRPSIKRTGAPGGPWPAGEHPHQRGADDRHGCCRHCPQLISGIVVLPVRCTGRIFIKMRPKQLCCLGLILINSYSGKRLSGSCWPLRRRNPPQPSQCPRRSGSG